MFRPVGTVPEYSVRTRHYCQTAFICLFVCLFVCLLQTKKGRDGMNSSGKFDKSSTLDTRGSSRKGRDPVRPAPAAPPNKVKGDSNHGNTTASSWQFNCCCCLFVFFVCFFVVFFFVFFLLVLYIGNQCVCVCVCVCVCRRHQKSSLATSSRISSTTWPPRQLPLPLQTLHPLHKQAMPLPSLLQALRRLKRRQPCVL